MTSLLLLKLCVYVGLFLILSDTLLFILKHFSLWEDWRSFDSANKFNNVKIMSLANNFKMINLIFCVILVTLPWAVSRLYRKGRGRGKEEDRNSPLPVAGITKMPGLIGLVQFDFILTYFLIIVSIHLSKSFILFLNFFDSRSKWYWITSKEEITMKQQLSALLDNNKAENVSQNRAYCFMVTNRPSLEMDECGARHYYICEKNRGTLKKMDI